MMVKEADGQLYLCAVNRESNELDAVLSVKGAKAASDVEGLQ